MKIEECINYLLTQTQIKVNQQFRENLRIYGVTPAQYILLYYLWEEDGLAPTALAAQSGLDASTITGLLTRIEEKGLIERRHSTNDRRGVNVYLTKQGVRLREKIERAIEKSNEEALCALNENEKAALKSALKRILRREDMQASADSRS